MGCRCMLVLCSAAAVAAFGCNDATGPRVGLEPAPGSPIVVGQSAYSLAGGDLNSDGLVDLVVTIPTGLVALDTLVILLGNGNGTFQAASRLPTGRDTRHVLIADFTPDATPDLVIANAEDDVVLVRPGNGNATLQAAETSSTGRFPMGLAAGDLNGDGVPDLAVAAYFSGAEVLLGAGAGAFDTNFVIAGGQGVSAVAVADLNNDGRQDVVAVNSQYNQLGILLGKGDGTFDLAPLVDVAFQPIAIAVADYDRDGVRDLALTMGFSNDVAI